MMTNIMIKFMLILPLILLVDYIAMVMLGCASCFFGLGDGYYCSTYCLIGKGLLLLSAIIFGIIIYPEIKKLLRHKQNGPTEEKQESF